MLGNDNGTDGQTDRQTDRQSATHYAAPPREEGRIISKWFIQRRSRTKIRDSDEQRLVAPSSECRYNAMRAAWAWPLTFWT